MSLTNLNTPTNLTSLTTSEFMKLEQNFISSELKVSNPTLLKTGILGALVNAITIIKSDNANFLNGLMKEVSPATAETYKSLFFHATVKNIDISFSAPATFALSFIIPEITLTNGQVLKYTIGREVQLEDENGYGFTLEDPIEIYVTNGMVRGRKYLPDKIEELDVYRVKHPLDVSQYIYLVNTEVKQYDRKFKVVTIPELREDGYTFNMELPSIDNIYQINAWRRSGESLASSLVTDDFRTYKSEDLDVVYELIPLDIKYTKSLSNQTDNHIFVNFNDTSIVFTTGDGINGRKPKLNENIVIELKSTQGRYGNLPSTQFNVGDILVESLDVTGVTSSKVTTIKAVSVTGGSGGSNLESKSDIKRKLLNTRGEYLGCIADIKNEFYLDSGEPYVDKKYFNSKHNVFVYNIIRDKASKIIPTTTKNITLAELEKNPFLPEMEYDGIPMISPFYYVNFKNRINAYLILPEIKIDLISEPGTAQSVKLENNPIMYLTYDWFERKTYIELRSVNINYKYYMTCNINQNIVFSAGNNFRVELNKTFLNSWCLLDGFEKSAYNPDSAESINVPGYLNNITLTVKNEEVKVIKFLQANTTKYKQTILKQQHFYWYDVDMFDTTLSTCYVLNLPFIEKKFVSNDIVYAAQKFDSFFQVIDLHDRVNPNIEITQAFYNTIKIENIYRNYIFETTDVYVQPVISVNLELLVSSINLQRSKWTNTTDLETDMIWLIQDYLNSLEGYQLEFNESKLEQLILNYFNQYYNVIENVRLWNPAGPIRVRGSSEVYSLFEENYGSSDLLLTEAELQTKVLKGDLPQLVQKQIIDFVPPYFSFSSNIGITIKIN